jgi:hypothetical protein
MLSKRTEVILMSHNHSSGLNKPHTFLIAVERKPNLHIVCMRLALLLLSQMSPCIVIKAI